MEKKLLDEIFSENIVEVNKLIKSGVNVNFVDESGDSPLSIAVETQNYKLIHLLLENRADPNLSIRFPVIHTAIDTAVEATKNNDEIMEDSTKIVELLLKYGANPDLKDSEGRTAYQFAKNYHLPAAKLLEK